MIEYSKVFIDTTPFIYFLDNDVNFGKKTKEIFEEIIRNQKTMASSVISAMEYLVYPYRTDNLEKINAFHEFTRDCEIPLYEIDMEIAKQAAAIRARYKSFKAMDSIQLAVALCSGCDLFLTNDIQLCKFIELNCVTVEDWVLNK